ncbi:MAG TPA: dethiobiotin synthase [Candidatus Binataceae bacterium]|nr:dethiobiotin synthase [Candidatus Binataceae bacterium]
MSLNFLITGTDTGVGKSTVGCALGFALRARGMRVGVMKPAETGCEERGEIGAGVLDPADARALALAAGCGLPLDLICPYRYRSPLAPPAAAERDGLPPPDPARIARCFREIASGSEAVLVESVGGLAAPLAWGFDNADLAAMLGLPLIVVIANRLGCLNAAMLTFSYARAKRLEIAGWLLNDAEPADTPAALTNAASLARMTDVPRLGTMRHKEPLAKSIVEKLLARSL